MKFEIGDKVKVYGSQAGTVTDVLESKKGGTLYEIHFEGDLEPCETFFEEDSLQRIIETDPTITFKIDIADNVVVAIMLQGERQIGRGHGHIIHSGSIGIAQATSYALKMLYTNMNGGSMIGGEYRG